MQERNQDGEKEKDGLIKMTDLPIEVQFKYLLRDYKKRNVYIGQLLAEIDELKYKLKEKTVTIQNVISLKDIPKSERKQMLFEYYEKKGIEKSPQKKIDKLKKENRKLLEELIIAKQKLKEHGK